MKCFYKEIPDLPGLLICYKSRTYGYVEHDFWEKVKYIR